MAALCAKFSSMNQSRKSFYVILTRYISSIPSCHNGSIYAKAVIRVSKHYLPYMSALLSHNKVTVHVGDGFKFLAENTSTYDVIITDSSDPVGPAESLFQKPYFQLLHDALAPGGHISTQAECLWLHLPLIKELRTTTRELFPVAEYAFTTIPTYPSGQIGFLVCSKMKGRDIKTPVRKVPDTIYYNEHVHKAAFILPEFGRSMVEDGKNITPKLGRAASSQQVAKPKKKILLLGSGYVARPCAEYVVRDVSNELTVACRTIDTAKALAEGLPNATAISLDANSTASLEAAVAAHDLVISLIPYTYHATVIKAAIKGKTHVVTTSYISPAMRELDEEAKKAGIVVMNEIGLDPGIDHLYAVKTIEEVHAKGGKVRANRTLGITGL
jgi:spermidine synthase / saccharopine dehydrogenase (NADP+, L-glutamate-forming)